MFAGVASASSNIFLANLVLGICCVILLGHSLDLIIYSYRVEDISTTVVYDKCVPHTN